MFSLSPDKIQYNVSNVFHMLRHFESNDTNILSELIHHGYSEAQIQNEITLTGSRFHSDFADNIPSLLKRLFEFRHTKQTGDNGNLIIDFTANDRDQTIGTSAVVGISDLSTKQKSEIYTELNRSYLMQHLNVDFLPKTNKACVILKPVKDYFQFITAFPGVSAMPIPNKEMDNAIYKKCKEYWDRHVFLKLTDQ